MDLFMQRASSFAGDIDRLVWLVTFLTGFWFLLAEGVFFWLIFRFRAKDGVASQYVTGKEKHLKRWITWPHNLIILCDVVIIAAAVKVWANVKQSLPRADDTVRVIGQQWVWTFQHSGPDHILDTPDDILVADELHVEVNKTYHFLLESKDVLHSFSVPVFRLKQDAVPGRTITGWFKATQVGAHDVQCAEMCGIGHGIMMGRIFIETPEQHAAWYKEHSPEGAAAAADTTAADSTASPTS